MCSAYSAELNDARLKAVKTILFLVLPWLAAAVASAYPVPGVEQFAPASERGDDVSPRQAQSQTGFEVGDSLITLNVDSLLPQLQPRAKGKGSRADMQQKSSLRAVPSPNRALWLSLILPGAGQIYNRKYWKLPIIYGGFIGCTYALLWNQQMYDDYSQAYLDIMDDDPNTASYKNMLPMGYDITGREEQFKKIFRHKRDYYRKYRDMSIFAFFGVYLVSVVDAYVDAQLSTFDISKDLSLTVEPATIELDKTNSNRRSRAVGLQCSLSF